MHTVRAVIVPQSSWGKWSVVLAATCLVVFVLAEVMTGFEVLGPDKNRALAVALTVVLAAISVGALVVGLVSILRSRERSVLVFLATAFCLYSSIGAIVSLLGLPK